MSGDDIKIGDMTAWVGALTGNEYFPLVTGGLNYKATLSQLTLATAGILPVANGGTGKASWTANGVIYASAPGALASGAALTFDGTNWATTGRATAASFVPSGSTVPTNGLYLPAANTLAWATNSTERARLDTSGNLLIGTTSNGFSSGSGLSIFRAGVATIRLDSNGLKQFEISIDSSGALATLNSAGSASQMVFKTANVEAMRIDASGNLGIGATAPKNKLEIVGSFGRGAPVTKTADFTLAATENWVINNRAATNTVTLPAASSWTGREVTLSTIQAQTVVSASSNVVPLAGGAAGTAILAGTAGKWATLVSDGTNWVIMQGN